MSDLLVSQKPSPEALARIEKSHRVLSRVFLVGSRPVVKFSIQGQEQIPRTGPLVILANHVSSFDAPGISARVGRPVIYLGSAGLLGTGVRKRFLGGLGVIPKNKFVSDARAIRTLKRWADAGAAVGLFPEGERSWDGYPLPLVPGIDKLIRLLGAPVVTARIHNADRQWPRWATRPRRGRVHLAFDPPVKFDRKAPAQQILSYLQERITLPPEKNRRWPVTGTQLAEGLPNLVYCCPSCGALETLETQVDDIGCTACTRSWTVDTTNCLHDRQDGSILTVAQAAQRARESLGTHWVQDLPRYEAEGVIMESETMSLLDQSGDDPVEIGQGRLQLRSDSLVLAESSVEWSLSLSEIRSVSIEMTRGLRFMTTNGIYEPVMPTESVIKWRDVLSHWMS
jgi:1-acyl-sn-glycerol-3-phosphate acyltransferase